MNNQDSTKNNQDSNKGKRAEGALLIIDRLYIEGHISNTEQGVLRRAILLPEKGGVDND